MNTRQRLTTLLLATLGLLVAGCSGGGGGDGISPPTQTTFNVRNARLLLAHSSTVKYQKASFTAAASTGGSNLVALGADGSSWPAIASAYNINVMYSVTSPDGLFLYLALDGSDESASPFIADNNCALYKVKIADNSYHCVTEGVHLKAIDQKYTTLINNQQKPIQFDASGKAYFLAWPFDSQCWEGSSGEPLCTIANPTGGAFVYRYDPQTGLSTTLTPEAANLPSFIAMPSGDIALNSWESGLDYDQIEWLSADDGSRTVLNPSNMGVQFFTVDSNETLIWGDWDTDLAVRFTRMGAGNVLEHAGLTKEILLKKEGASGYLVDRVLVGDDGRLYVAFTAERKRWDAASEQNIPNMVEVVQQVLPYDPVPVAELEFSSATSTEIWQWLDSGPFQLAADHFYYIDSTTDATYGVIDTVHMVRLADRSDTELLSATLTEIAAGASYYDIYQWRLSGGTLYFAALDKGRDVVVLGTIDTAAVQQGLPEADYLTLQDVGTIEGAVNAIEDIEVIAPAPTTTDPGGAPVLEQFHTEAQNTHYASIDFSKEMNPDSVEGLLSLTQGAFDVPYLPLWLGRILHLIPDLDGLANTTSTPLANATVYSVAVGASATDRWGTPLSSGDVVTYPLSQQFTTLPASGWYTADTDVVGSPLTSGGVARYAGTGYLNPYSRETYDSGLSLTGNLRLEFSARNYGLTGIETILWDQTNGSLESSIQMDMQEGALVNNITLRGEGVTMSSVGYGAVFNGEWRRYRIDFVGTTLTLYTSEDGVTFTAVPGASIGGLPDRMSAGGGFRLLLRMDREMLLDDLLVQQLDINGAIFGTQLDEGFSDTTGIAAAGLDSDVTNDYGLFGM